MVYKVIRMLQGLLKFAYKLNRLAPAIIAGGCAIGLIVAWLPEWGDRQLQYLISASIILVATLLLFLWFLFLSGVRKGRRLPICGLIIALIIGAGYSLRVEEVSGDLVPRLVFRWQKKASLQIPEPDPAGKKEPLVSTPGSASRPAASGSNADYPQFLGPGRNAVVAAAGIRWDLNQYPPVELWRRPVGAGWSAFSIVGNRAVTQEQRGESECVVCYQVQTGEVLWSHSDRARFEEVLGGVGPRATPTTTRSRVFTMGATGILNCLKLADGSPVWSVDVLAEYGCPNQSWGKSGSPLLAGDLVIVCAGRNNCPGLVAYRQGDGAEAWKSPAADPGYSSPSLSTLAGRPQILVLNNDVLNSHDPSDGAILWSHPWPGSRPKVTQPVTLENDLVLLSSGYGVGCELIEVSSGPGGALGARSIWKNRNLKSKFSNIVIHKGDAYGLDDGIMVCIDLETGKRRWKGGRYGHGQIMLAGETIVVLSERGELVVIQPDPTALRETVKLKLIEGKTWNHPALGAPYLLVRNATEAACYKLQLESQ